MGILVRKAYDFSLVKSENHISKFVHPYISYSKRLREKYNLMLLYTYSTVIQELEHLLDMHEVNIDASDSLSGDTPLCGAAGVGQNGSCIVLLHRGASLSEANLKECWPLYMATRQVQYSFKLASLRLAPRCSRIMQGPFLPAPAQLSRV